MAQYKVGDIDLSLSAFSKDAVASLDTVISKLTTMRTLTRDIAKDLRSISNVKVKAPTIANGDGTTLGEKTGNVTQMSEKSAKSIDTTKSKLRELAVQAGKTFAGIRERGGEAFGTLTKGIQKAGRALVRVAFYRVIRTVIKFVTDQVGAGLKSLSLVSTELQTAFAQLGVASSNFGNALALTIYPLIVAVAPYVQRLSEWLIDIANAFSYLAYQAGIVDKLFIASKGSIDEYNKALNKTTASYDKFEHLTGGNTLSGIGGFEEVDPEDATIIGDIAEKAEKLKGVLTAIAALLLAITAIKIGNGIMWLLTNGTSLLSVLKWEIAIALIVYEVMNLTDAIKGMVNEGFSDENMKKIMSSVLGIGTAILLLTGQWIPALIVGLLYVGTKLPGVSDAMLFAVKNNVIGTLNLFIYLFNRLAALATNFIDKYIRLANAGITVYNLLNPQDPINYIETFAEKLSLPYAFWTEDGISFTDDPVELWKGTKDYISNQAGSVVEGFADLFGIGDATGGASSTEEGKSGLVDAIMDKYVGDIESAYDRTTDKLLAGMEDIFDISLDIDGEKVASATLPHTERLLERQGKEFAKKYS